MRVTPYEIAQRFIGTKEIPGSRDNPQVLAMLQLDAAWPDGDEVPWCSAFTNYVAWLLRLPRSKSLSARSWLAVGTPVPLEKARANSDVVILKRGEGDQPGPEVLAAPGHVGFFSGLIDDNVYLLGGNQSNQVNVSSFPKSRVLGVRRLTEDY